jgi:hypothetical protein
VTFTIEPWDPAYGMAFNAELDDDALAKSSAELNLDLEVKASLWQPIDPDPSTRLPAMVNFLDGSAASTPGSGFTATAPSLSPASRRHWPRVLSAATDRPASPTSRSNVACSPEPRRRRAS